MISYFGVLTFGMGAVTFVYASIGLTGYATYSENVEPTITQNLPKDEKFCIIILLIFL